MEDQRWIRLVTVGLVLAALAVGYFLLTGRFNSNNQAQPNNQVTNQNPTPIPIVSETITPKGGTAPVQATPPATSPSPSPSAVAARGNITTLPRTGHYLIILGMISTGVMISGLGLRKFPH